ncbi:RESISTANCE PROTEIN RGA2 putative-RELATED [Salix purpurea]|uniref:RESISTANCE PROTEIN RGA2 putative-RELATED n=1 Tax=Salix purpurea TaxID=77065 RepID=A0A9Q0VS07_SALPP|nr:RESISTANCE PROTEIN RGA2 putative-RELATED [Salix purpurea]
MKIVFGANLKQIFYSGEGDALTRDGIINFPQLRQLTLSSCNFFGPKNLTAQLPSLQVLYIEEHEELGDMLAQLQGHTNLREIHITDCEGAQEIMQVGSFVTNKRIGQEISLLSLEKLDLSFLPDMRCIWKGLVLSHLTTLEVCYCQKLTHVFTRSMVASLLQLQFLKIFACEELEQIIAKDDDDEKDEILSGSDLQSLCFPNLCQVEIYRCNKLRSLFPVAMAAGLPKLETLDIRHSSQLLGVFGQDDHASPVNVEKQMEFPNLSFLRLYNLPSIIFCFSLGCDDFLFSRPEMLLMVHECPKLTTKFPRKTNGSMSAPSEVLVIRFDFMPFI